MLYPHQMIKKGTVYTKEDLYVTNSTWNRY